MKTLDQLIPKFTGIKAYEEDLRSVDNTSANVQPVVASDSPKNVRHNKKVKVVDEIDPKLRQVANEKRLKTLQDKLDYDKRQQSVVKEAINSGQRVNKRIVFSDDNDVPFDGQLSALLSQEKRKSSDNSVQMSKAKQLFDSDSDDSDGSDDKEGLKDFDLDLNKKINDKNAEKLIELNARFAHDSRFRIDERFLDQLEDNGEEVVDEKQKNLNILEEVLGKKFKPIIKTSDNRSERMSNANENNLFVSRFDPKSDKSSKYELNSSSSANKKLKKVSFDETVVTKSDDKKVEVSKEVYYEVSTDLMDSLAKKDDEFSLTQMFGSNSSESDDRRKDFRASNERLDDKPIVNNKRKLDVIPNPFKYDSSSSDDEEDEEDVEVVAKGSSDTQSGSEVKPKPSPNSFKFFFTKNDTRFAEDVFYSKEAVERARNGSKDRQIMLMRAMSVRKRSAKKNKKSEQKIWIKSKNNKFNHNFKRFKKSSEDLTTN